MYTDSITINVKFFMIYEGVEMNTKTLTKIHKFGRMGKIASTVLLIAAIAAAVLIGAATAYVALLSRDAVVVNVTNHAEIRIDGSKVASPWGILGNSIAWSTDQDPSGTLRDGSLKILPPEDQEFETDLSIFNQTYSSAVLHTDGDIITLDAKSSPSEYHFRDFAAVLIALVLVIAASAVTLWMLRRMFGVIAVCDSPFCEDLVKKMKAFGVSLLPLALLATVGESLARAFLSAGRESGLCIQWGILLAFLVTMCLVTVFRYGVQLQKESDETL